ncbi:D-alanyl-D-alanine carboxypeptidase/D-alanyl-D-alanine-endopeptidase [Cryobacterium psychrophilum]|uniref:D-alanyl-D-alanine carboxypeptidase n=1 Tax=Cryobacterium psychrophilum TaxID=41988 RepID=A0A4Y8KKD6_9MICO|nr:D-alanyl-D-alanine carboxypeptidase [Cryobacterium psychrophilum]TDW30612.1 D-alanyl-D-alanine carboxypeptidase/D-alanyl-D-alanine-endopeptidase (penicillin-binding protein 4) [Cryobacterium psychrophilum]TFD77035.1 D-alanyl-D-alanine carboxypeptidase [Cryobacterium psychrophilum]
MDNADLPADAVAREPGRGLGAAFARHPRIWLIGAGALVLALFGTGAVFAGVATVGDEPSAASVVTTATPTPTATVPPARPAPAAATAASQLRTCSVAGLAADSRLANFQAQVVNASTGEVLFDRGGTTASATASALKVITSAAALSVLGPDYRASTTVVKGAESGQVVLVGGGDLTLSRLPTGSEPFYTGAAHLDDLAAQVRTAWDADPANAGVPLTSLVLDTSYFSGPAWDDGWARAELSLGYMPAITALQVDGDRDNPARSTSPRSEDPIGRAGSAFAEALGGAVTVTRGAAPAGAAQLAAVQSQPVSTLIKQALIVSDNTIAEMLARLVSVTSGAGNSFSSLQQGIVGGLAGYGIDTTGIVIKDGSGLSPANAVPPRYFAELFIKINAREGNLGVIFDGLPVAGGPSGSLSYSDRFSGANAVADGAVFAKTGWITNGYTLAGVIHSADGTPLTFAVYALGNVRDNAKQAIDTITTAFFRCGDNLSNN